MQLPLFRSSLGRLLLGIAAKQRLLPLSPGRGMAQHLTPFMRPDDPKGKPRFNMRTKMRKSGVHKAACGSDAHILAQYYYFTSKTYGVQQKTTNLV
jgi:hypothetical protein